MNSAYFQPLGRQGPPPGPHVGQGPQTKEPHDSIASQPPAAWAGASLGLGWPGSRLALVWLAFLRLWASKFTSISAGLRLDFGWIWLDFGWIRLGFGFWLDLV